MMNELPDLVIERRPRWWRPFPDVRPFPVPEWHFGRGLMANVEYVPKAEVPELDLPMGLESDRLREERLTREARALYARQARAARKRTSAPKTRVDTLTSQDSPSASNNYISDSSSMIEVTMEEQTDTSSSEAGHRRLIGALDPSTNDSALDGTMLAQTTSSLFSSSSHFNSSEDVNYLSPAFFMSSESE